MERKVFWKVAEVTGIGPENELQVAVVFLLVVRKVNREAERKCDMKESMPEVENCDDM